MLHCNRNRQVDDTNEEKFHWLIAVRSTGKLSLQISYTDNWICNNLMLQSYFSHFKQHIFRCMMNIDFNFLIKLQSSACKDNVLIERLDEYFPSNPARCKRLA